MAKKNSHVIIFDQERKSWVVARAYSFNPTKEELEVMSAYKWGIFSFTSHGRTQEKEEWVKSVLERICGKKIPQVVTKIYEVRPVNPHDNFDEEL